METIKEFKGLWWIPTNSEKKIAGELRYSRTEDTTLELIGEFQEGDWLHDINDQRRYDIIYGISSDGKDVTIIASVPIDATLNSSCSFPLVKYIAPMIVHGKHLLTPDEKFLSRITVSYDELSIWYRPDLIKHVVFSRKVIFAERNTERYELRFEIDSNTTFILSPKVDVKLDATSHKFIQYTNLLIEFKQPVDLQKAIRLIDGFNQFLSFATFSSVQCKEICFDYNGRADNHIYYHFSKEEYKPFLEHFRYLFTYDTIKEKYPTIIKKWYEDDNIIPIRTHLIQSLNRDGKFSSADFLVVIQAIDGYYKRFKKAGTDLYKILVNLVNEFSDVNCLELVPDDFWKIVNSRDYYSHLLPVRKKEHILSWHELHELDFQLRKLLICCLLQFIGFDNNEINTICSRSYNEALDLKRKSKLQRDDSDVHEIKCDVIDTTYEHSAEYDINVDIET